MPTWKTPVNDSHTAILRVGGNFILNCIFIAVKRERRKKANNQVEYLLTFGLW
jgi:hypothetical protein